jgi:hypothetical protein
MKVGILSIFSANKNGHGGEKRSFQIHSLFDNARLLSLNLYTVDQNYIRRLLELVPTIKSLKILYKTYGLLNIIDFLKYTRRINNFNKNVIPKLVDLDLIIWENNDYEYLFIPFFVREYSKVKIYAFPHNIEALVYSDSQLSSFKLIRLKHEIKSLEVCDKVFTISREENWLLKSFNINSRYLPYHIDFEFQQSKILITNRILIVGTYYNPPTKTGLINLLDYISTNIKEFDKYEFWVIGFGTEALLNYQMSNIKIIGQVDSMQELLNESSIILINQQNSSGALTKINEFIQYGYHIICNSDSRRSYFDFEEIREFENFNEIPSILNSIMHNLELKKGFEMSKEKISNIKNELNNK